MNIILFVFFKLRDCGHLRITGLQAAVKLSQEGPPGWGVPSWQQKPCISALLDTVTEHSSGVTFSPGPKHTK